MPSNDCRWLREGICTSPLVVSDTSVTESHCPRCRVRNHEPEPTPSVRVASVAAPFATEPVAVCDHLGRSVPPPPGADVRRAWHQCDNGHGVVCSCNCSRCPDHSERPRTPVPEPLAVRGTTPGYYVASNEGRGDLLRDTLTSCRAAGIDPSVIVNPPPVRGDYAKSSRDYLNVLRLALADSNEYSVVLEDDVTVDPQLLQRLASIPLLRRSSLPFLSLFIPDLIADPWERSHPDLGYRIARSELLRGANGKLWQRGRLWGSQGYVFRRDLLSDLVANWNSVKGGQDARVLSLAVRFGAPLAYSDPCLIEHRPLRSNFGTPAAYAPDFGSGWQVKKLHGYLHPDGVPGWLTYAEGELLFRSARGLRVIELGTYRGRSTLALAQSAASVVSVDTSDQSEAIRAVRDWGFADRVTFRSAMEWTPEPCDMVYCDTDHDARSVWRDLENSRKCGARWIAVHDYPDPQWPDVRRVVDSWMPQHGFRRVGQAGFLGLFYSEWRDSIK